MNVLSSTFWGEGRTDERFLPILIQRVLDSFLFNCGRGQWEAQNPIVLHTNTIGFVESVVDIAKQSVNFHLLFVHTDADAPSIDHKAMPNKIKPALEAILGLPEESVCRHLVAVIPVTKTENWKLADLVAIEQILGVTLDRQSLGLNKRVNNLEEYADSKKLWQKIIKETDIMRKRRNAFVANKLDDALAQEISLSELYRFKSFRHFLDGLKKALIDQNIIDSDCDPHF
jgi:hypothetical protein